VVFDEYEIIARGELSAREERAFRGMTLTQSGGKVVLSGPVRDQDDLDKLLRRVHGLGLTLLSVRSPGWRVGVTGVRTPGP
jgi:hypothetical protein